MQAQSYNPAGAHHLPQLLTPFVGREQELAEIPQLLADPACCLLTLLGPGGIGKTRLAIQTAASLFGDFANGVYFVSLQPVLSSESLIPAVADALNIQLTDQQEPQLDLFDFLQDKKTLLLLDNFEHLLEAAPILTELLQAAPGVKLLVTSREALNLPEEWLFPVGGMPYPAAAESEDVEKYSAVRLFAGCARRIRPDFSVADEQDAIIGICQLTRGTPLALELAASWVKTMRPAEIVAEIQRNLDFLTSRWRGIPEKHRSMRAVFNQSWTLLDPAQQAAFKRLAVFRGGFRRKAAEQIAGATLASLSALVDKSLLHWEPGGRYQIHELLRQYAAEQLVQSPEDVARIYDLHAGYYTRFLADQAEGLWGGRQREALLEIEAEIDNIRAAWQWAVDQLKVEDIQKSADPLGIFYDFRGRYLEGARTFEQALTRLKGLESDPQAALTLAILATVLGGLYVRLGRLEEAEAQLHWGEALYRRLDLPPIPGFATDPVFMLGIIASIRGDYVETALLAERSLRTSEAHGHLLNRGAAYYLLGRAAFLEGQYEAARQHFQQAYTISQTALDRWFMAYCLMELGNIEAALGHYRTASDHYTAGYNIREEFNDPEGMAVALNHLGQIALRQSHYAEARQLYQKSLAIAREINNRGSAATALAGLGETALAQEEFSTARQWFNQALKIAREGQFVSFILGLLAGIGELLARTGQPERGQDLLALVQHHPGSEYETRQRARQRLAHLPAGDSLAGSRPISWGELENLVTLLEAELAGPPEAAGRADVGESAYVSALSGSTALVEPLTEREIEVLQLLAQGLSNPEIAEKLVLAVGTVKYYTSEIYGKLGVRNRTQAAARGRDLGLL